MLQVLSLCSVHHAEMKDIFYLIRNNKTGLKSWQMVSSVVPPESYPPFQHLLLHPCSWYRAAFMWCLRVLWNTAHGWWIIKWQASLLEKKKKKTISCSHSPLWILFVQSWRFFSCRLLALFLKKKKEKIHWKKSGVTAPNGKTRIPWRKDGGLLCWSLSVDSFKGEWLRVKGKM